MRYLDAIKITHACGSGGPDAGTIGTTASDIVVVNGVSRSAQASDTLMANC